MSSERETGNYKVRGDLLLDIDPSRTEEERAAEIYYFDLKRVAYIEGLDTFHTDDEVTKRLKSIERRLSTKEMRKGLPVNVRESTDQAVQAAGAFYSEFIKPWLATGNDTYKPTEEDITHFCERAANGIGVNLVQYYALSKTQSHSRTGSPDSKIDYAELEMLRYQSIMARVARELGININITLVDETDILPEDEYLGIKRRDTRINRLITEQYLKEQGVTDRIRIRSLRDSIAIPLGEDFQAAYDEQFALSENKTKAAVIHPQERNTALVRRIITLLDCMPNSGLEAQGIDPDNIEDIRRDALSGDLEMLPSETLQYLIGLTAHIDAMMALRESAKEAVRQKDLIREFPEYEAESRVYGGVTRSTHRWSFLPHPTKYMGRTVNPMHGLAGYNSEGTYIGNIPFNMLKQMQDESKAQLVFLDDKPILGRVTSKK